MQVYNEKQQMGKKLKMYRLNRNNTRKLNVSAKACAKGETVIVKGSGARK